MPTTRMSFAAPFQPDTAIGSALLNISKAFFSGPGPAQQEAARMAAERSRLGMEVDQRKLDGQDKLAGIVDTATGFSRYAPGNKRDPNDPNWDTNAGSAADFYRRYPGELAAASLRSGVDVGQASSARVLASSSPDYQDKMRIDSAIGAGQKVGPDSAFSEKGQLGARAYEINKATSAAAAANPDKYHKVALAKGIIGDDVKGQDARRYVNIDPAPTGDMQNAEARARKLNLDATEEQQLNDFRKEQSSYKSFLGSGYDAKAHEAANPEKFKRGMALELKSMRAFNQPNIPGYQPDPASPNLGTAPSKFRPGVRIRVEKDPNTNRWYAHEPDETGKIKLYPIER